MKTKTIKAILLKKFNEWIATITDEKVKNLVKSNTIITGGCIASMLLKEDVNDFDVYFTNKETTKAVALYYMEIFNKANGTVGYVLDGADKDAEKHSGVVASLNMTEDRIKVVFDSVGVAKEDGLDIAYQEEYIAEENKELEDESKGAYRPIFMSPNAITLSNKIQIVIRFYGEAEKIHDNYDFIHCTNYWLSKDYSLNLKQKALEAIIAKELVYVGSKYPIASIIRTRKFIKRFWSINAGQYLKMAFQVSLLDLTNIEVLEDQLVGVDSAYFTMLIDALKEAKQEKLTYDYLANIIDKIF